MARLKKTEEQKGDILFRKMVGMLLGVTGMTKVQLATRVGVSEGTFRTRMKRPETLTKREERIICRLCTANGIHYESEF